MRILCFAKTASCCEIQSQDLLGRNRICNWENVMIFIYHVKADFFKVSSLSFLPYKEIWRCIQQTHGSRDGTDHRILPPKLDTAAWSGSNEYAVPGQFFALAAHSRTLKTASSITSSLITPDLHTA
ncbi:hypothetical protein SAY86_019834 [Trapa natans]|uniref:Uncharacterized protein n=1 Tax=Trapa natans TaxID=22666 RepID=A0AAN7LZH6_TRANT|nr:hypothetical protein SAY86_019834 [Trapa natans]